MTVLPLVNILEKTPKTKIHGDSTVWKHTKKTWKNGKSLIFQKSLTSLKRVQITFWIVEKIAVECFNPNPKDEKIHKPTYFLSKFFMSSMGFWGVLKKWKFGFCLLIPLKRVVWQFWHVEKKLVVCADIHQKFYENRAIIGEMPDSYFLPFSIRPHGK